MKKKDLEEEDEKYKDKEEKEEKFLIKERNQRIFEENPNDLLLKYDAETEKFHFIEHPLAKIKEKIRMRFKKYQSKEFYRFDE